MSEDLSILSEIQSISFSFAALSKVHNLITQTAAKLQQIKQNIFSKFFFHFLRSCFFFTLPPKCNFFFLFASFSYSKMSDFLQFLILSPFTTRREKIMKEYEKDVEGREDRDKFLFFRRRFFFSFVHFVFLISSLHWYSFNDFASYFKQFLRGVFPAV